MPTKIQQVIDYLSVLFPISYQESYDNSGSIIGDASQNVKGVLCTLDITMDVLCEALKKNCNLIVSHHPVIFKGIKNLSGKNETERIILKAIQHNLVLFAMHTNVDNMIEGVNGQIAKQLHLNQTKVLQPKANQFKKLQVYVPKTHKEQVLNALFEAGAGSFIHYKGCSFSSSGTGTFFPNQNANPSIGQKDQLNTVEEDKIELIVPFFKTQNIVDALLKSHPYEEVAYDILNLENGFDHIGSGIIGTLEKPIKSEVFLKQLKDWMKTDCIRHTKIVKPFVEKIAICGGSGQFLLSKAIGQNADVFISSDFKYHDFFEAENKIIIADIGHFESEQYTICLFAERLKENFTKFAVFLSEGRTNPIFYI